MKKRSLIALIVLVVINLSALATMSYHRYCRYRETCRIGKQAESCGYLCEILGLSDRQTTAIDTLRRRFEIEAGNEYRELARFRRLLMDELSCPRPDTLKLDTLCFRIAAAQTRLQKRVVRNILNEKMILDPDQRARYLDLIRSRMLDEGNAAQPIPSNITEQDCDIYCPQFN